MSIPVLYFRSSSMTQWDYCQISYFLTYNLGYQQPGQKKSNLGTITHKTLECLAQAKKRLQLGENKGMKFIDSELGEIKFTKKSLYSNKFVHDILGKAYCYYVDHDKVNDYHPTDDYEFCKQMVYNCLDYNGSNFYDPRNMQIVAPEKSFNLPIMEDWAEFEYQGTKQRLHVKGTMDLITEASPTTLEYVDYKGLPINTEIPTPLGWTTMGNLRVGDKVFDMDGKITSVIGKSNVKNKPCYQITFDDTSVAICDDEHLWTLNTGEVVSVTDLKKCDKISVCQPLILEDQKLPIDPYVLGIWLGDGRNKNGEICGNDPFIFEEIKRRGYDLGGDISSSECPQYTVYGLRTQLRKLGLLHNKHIPLIYLRSSYNQRLDLLRGLMDSDGSVNTIRKQGVFTNCNKKLSDDTKELLLTLGQRPLQSSVKAYGFGLEVNNYPLSFRPININPFLLPRKADRIDPNWGPGESNFRLIKDIKLIDNQDTQCIMVDSKTSTYLCTRNMIPTHNTGQRLDWATGQVKTYEKLQSDLQLLLYYYAMTRIYPNYDSIIMTIFFLRDGGPFSLCFDSSDKDKFLQRLKDRFFEIKDSNIVKPINPQRSDFRCKRLCHYYKTNWPGTNTRMCNHVEDTIKTYGIEYAGEQLKAPNFELGFYSPPGAV